MANKRISSLDPLATPAVDDIIPVTDISDTTGSLQGTTKKVTVADLLANAPDNSTEVTLATVTNNYLTLSGQEITAGIVPVSLGGTGSGVLADARANLGLGTAATSSSTDFSSAFSSFVTPTLSGTPPTCSLSASDNNKVVIIDSTVDAYVTVPQSLGSGFNCTIVQANTGKVIIQAGSGVALNAPSNKLATVERYSAVQLVPVANDSFYLTGDIAVPPFVNSYSLQFATDDYLSSTTAISLTSNWSISFWIRPSGNHVILSNSGPVYIYFQNGNIIFRGPGGEVTTTTYTTNVWQHFVFTLDGSNNLEVYKNGSATGPYTYTSTSGWSFINVGRSVSYGLYFNGYLDELAVFDNLLSASDVSNIYNGEDAGGSGGSAGTVGDLSTFNSGNGPLHWWRMGDNGTGTTISDQGNASSLLDLTLNNFPSNPYSTSELP